MSDNWFQVRKSPVEVRAKGPIPKSTEIETPEGTLKADRGDYIVEGIEGEKYPIKPGIFSSTYDKIDGSTDIALSDPETSALVELLIEECQSTEGPDGTEASPELETILDKISPDWKERAIHEDVQTHTVIVHRSSD